MRGCGEGEMGGAEGPGGSESFVTTTKKDIARRQPHRCNVKYLRRDEGKDQGHTPGLCQSLECCKLHVVTCVQSHVVICMQLYRNPLGAVGHRPDDSELGSLGRVTWQGDPAEGHPAK